MKPSFSWLALTRFWTWQRRHFSSGRTVSARQTCQEHMKLRRAKLRDRKQRNSATRITNMRTILRRIAEVTSRPKRNESGDGQAETTVMDGREQREMTRSLESPDSDLAQPCRDVSSDWTHHTTSWVTFTPLTPVHTSRYNTLSLTHFNFLKLFLNCYRNSNSRVTMAVIITTRRNC